MSSTRWTPRVATLAFVALLLQPAAAVPRQDADYRALVDQFASARATAIDRMLAMPAGDVARGVENAVRDDSGWTTEAIDRALLMHGDAAIELTKRRSPDADRQTALAADLATAASRRRGNEWFAHSWFKAFTAQVTAPVVAELWRRQGWYRDAVAVDRGRELETAAGHADIHVDDTVFDPPEFRLAIPLFEQGIAAGLPVAALHLGRVRLLRDNETEARRLLGAAAENQSSRVTRYLAHLFLGAMEELAHGPAAEDHYRKALAALPEAQSGRLALSALFSRTGRQAEARTIIDASGASPVYDPWWSYFHGTPRDSDQILAELHVEVCR